MIKHVLKRLFFKRLCLKLNQFLNLRQIIKYFFELKEELNKNIYRKQPFTQLFEDYGNKENHARNVRCIKSTVTKFSRKTAPHKNIFINDQGYLCN